MNDRFALGFDEIAIDALHKETNIHGSYTTCRIKGCVKILSSPHKVEDKMKEIKTKFPDAKILQEESGGEFCGYSYVTIKLWEEK